MDKKQLIELLKKYEAGICTGHEKAMLETWYLSWKEDPGFKPGEEQIGGSLDRVWMRVQATVLEQRKVRNRRIRQTCGIAAAACLVLIAFLSFWWKQNQFRYAPLIAMQKVTAGEGMRKSILPDSSIVWLKPGAAIEFPGRFGRARQVSLKGAALFEVAKDSKRPFIVSVGDYTATALGTSFHIKQSEDRNDLELVVLTGKVKIAGNSKTTLSEELIVLSDHKIATSVPGKIRPISEKESMAYVSGTTYDMNFENTPFDQVVARIAQKFDVKVHFQAARYVSCRFTADLTDQALDYSLKFIAASAGADVEIKENTVLIKGGGCK